MAIIDVSSEEEQARISIIEAFLDKKDIPYWDYLPDEVCLRIFSFLTEEKAVQMAAVCKRFAMLTNEEAFWEEKAKAWVHTKVPKPDSSNGELRKHYVKLYKQNQDEEKRKQTEAEKARKQRVWEKKKKRIKNFFITYWSLGMMEVPTILAILLFTIFVALRLDEVIDWNYHLIFLPLYLAMANIFCGLSTTECVFYYFSSKRKKTGPPNNYYNQDGINAKSTATLIYEQITPISKNFRSKTSTFIWWATVLTAFFLLAESLNRQGIFYTFWCLVAMLVGIAILSGCYLSWREGSYFCSGDKAKGGMLLCAMFMFFTWMAMFFYFKSEFMANFSWYVAFIPWWIIGIISFIGLCISWVAFIANRHSSDFWLFAALIGTATTAFITIGAFLVLLAYNLDKTEYDQPAFAWTIVITPIIIFEIFSFCACCVLTGFVYFK
jgi:hypothetical protein